LRVSYQSVTVHSIDTGNEEVNTDNGEDDLGVVKEELGVAFLSQANERVLLL